MTKETAKLGRKWPWLVLVAIMIGAVVGASAWLVGPKIWTDGQTVRVPGSVARIRDVLWDPPRAIGPDFQSDQQQYEPSLSPDGTELYFVRNKPGQNADIYVSYRRNNRWTPPQALEAVNSPYDDLGPRLTPDGKFLLFYSDRPGGYGGYDIWASARTENGWAAPFNLGPGVNSEYNEFSPDPTPDGKHLIFSTNRKAAQGEQKQAWRATIRESGNGDYDLWIADLLGGWAADAEATAPADAPQTQPSTGPATLPTPINPQIIFHFAREIPSVNTQFMEGASCMSPAGDFLYFASNRPGGFGKFDIYRSRVSVGGDGVWNFAVPENVGPQINSADNETDPSIALNGFRLYFSTDRQSPDGVYRVLVSDSREVFPVHESRALPHVGVSFWVMLASLLALIPLLLFLRGWDDRKLGMLQRCLLLSLLVHLAICFALSFLKVTNQAYHLVRQEMGIELPVALSAPREAEIGYAIRRQSSSDLPVPGAESLPVAQTQSPIETVAAADPVDVGVPTAANQAASQALLLAIPKAARTIDGAQVNAEAQATRANAIETSVAAPAGVRQAETVPQMALPQPAIARSNLAIANVRESSPTLDAPAIPAAQRSSVAESIASADVEANRPSSIPRASDVSVQPSDAGSAAASLAPLNNVAAFQAAPLVNKAEAEPTIASARVEAPRQESGGRSDRAADTPLAVPRSDSVDRSAIDASALAPARRTIASISGASDPRTVPSVADIDPHSQTPDVGVVASAHPLKGSSEPPALTSPVNPVATTQPFIDSPIKQSQIASASLHHADAPPADARATPSIITTDSRLPRQHSPIAPTASGADGVAMTIPPALDVPMLSLPKAIAPTEKAVAANSEKTPDAQTPAFLASRTQHATEGGGPVNIQIDAGAAPTVAAAKLSGSGGADALQSRPRPTEMASLLVAPDASAIVPPPGDIGPAIPVVQSPFKMRAVEQHRPVIEQLGGTKESENAVDRGLAYLASVQEADGHWTMVTNSRRALRDAHNPHDLATTALSTLAFLAQDHRPDTPGTYQQNVSRALDFLLSAQRDDGDLRGPFAGGGADQGNMYDHGIATLALAEAAIMTRDPRYTQAALKGAQFIAAAQNRDTGGWRYSPGEYGDSSVFGWQIMALHSAQQIGFEIPPSTHRGIVRYIALASSGAQRMLAGYQPRESPTAPMTAEMVFCRMLLGQQLTDDEVEEVSGFLGAQPPQTGNPDIYYWYYGSLCMMQMQGDLWKHWNTHTRDMLVRTQRRAGQFGYWDNMKWEDRGGRVFATAMATLTLEVYYRYMPLQKKSEEAINAKSN